jgi:FkbM family methyltransferase
LLNDLIFDVGLHRGEDTAFYLKKGFRVVGIDANAELCALVQRQFAKEIETGRLTVLNAAIAENEGEVVFYKPVGGDWSTIWGTIDPEFAHRNKVGGVQSEECRIGSTTLGAVIERFGCPYYLKIDIEGFDMVALASLRTTAERPRYVSIEATKNSFRDLKREFRLFEELGYTSFKIVPQHEVHKQRAASPAREGKTVDHRFAAGESGQFGDDAPGKWLSADEAIEAYRRIFFKYALVGDEPVLPSYRARSLLRALGLKAGWYDTHARR